MRAGSLAMTLLGDLVDILGSRAGLEEVGCAASAACSCCLCLHGLRIDGQGHTSDTEPEAVYVRVWFQP